MNVGGANVDGKIPAFKTCAILFPKRNVLFQIPIIALGTRKKVEKKANAKRPGMGAFVRSVKFMCGTFVLLSATTWCTHIPLIHGSTYDMKFELLGSSDENSSKRNVFECVYRFANVLSLSWSQCGYFGCVYVYAQCHSSNQNDKRSNHIVGLQFRVTPNSSDFLLLFKTLFSLFFVSVFGGVRVCVRDPFFFLIGVGQIEWNHPLNGISRQKLHTPVRSSANNNNMPFVSPVCL